MAYRALVGTVGGDAKDIPGRVEAALEREMHRATSTAPPLLREAMRDAVFPGGARLRPSLCLAVALANGDPQPELSEAAASAVELVHCASLVHDDLPCFDDAALRRGKPTVHARFGEAAAVLVGDGLIVHAFDALAHAGAHAHVGVLAAATGAARGIIGGQAWESEPEPPLDEYHRAKTAALFEAAAMMGAMAASRDPAPWRSFGELIGRAYQAADDLADVLADSKTSGKSGGRDQLLGRPSVVRALGVQAARKRVSSLIARAAEEVPECPRVGVIWTWLGALAARVEAK